MKRIILSIFVIGIMAALANAESCTTVGEIGKKYTPEGSCDFKEEHRICCPLGSSKEWSAWKDIKDGEISLETGCTIPTQGKECEEGESGTGTVNLWGSSSDWSGKVVGKKTCRRVCKNGKWEYSFTGISCNSGWSEVAGGIDGRMCIIAVARKTGKIKGHPSSQKPKEVWKSCLPSKYKKDDECPEEWHGCWRYEGENEGKGVTEYLKCEDHGVWGSLTGKSYQVNRISIDWEYTLPAGCEGKFNFNGTEGEPCTDIGACTVIYKWKDNYTGQFLQCQEEDSTDNDEEDCSNADYD